jgi:transposase-like protein
MEVNYMATKNGRQRSPEEAARREKIRELLGVAGVSGMDDIQQLFRETIAEFMENGLDSELDEHLGYDRYNTKEKATDDSRNGYSSKTLRTSFGDTSIQVPRDRKGEFDPVILRKNQTSISQDVEAKIISMYAKGMTTSDIGDHIRDIYGIEVSESTVSRITDKVLPEAKEWQQRPLESIYAVMYMDAIHYHVRSEGQVVKKAVYVAIGIDLNGRKDVLGMWVGENESAKYWATVLNSLRNRGVEDIFIACTDNLTGFSNAIEAVYPRTDIQNCIIHQLRNSSKYVSYKDLKALMADLKQVYAAVDETAAEEALDRFAERWDRKYPKISTSWRANWPNLSTYFKFPEELRRLIYTTNAIEGFNRQLRKVTKSKAVFPTDDSLFKMLYLAMLDITKKWTGRRQDWSVIHAQLAVFYADRMPD